MIIYAYNYIASYKGKEASLDCTHPQRLRGRGELKFGCNELGLHRDKEVYGV